MRLNAKNVQKGYPFEHIVLVRRWNSVLVVNRKCIMDVDENQLFTDSSGDDVDDHVEVPYEIRQRRYVFLE